MISRNPHVVLIERAIRIRQTIILRPDINEQIKFRALVETSAEETGEEA